MEKQKNKGLSALQESVHFSQGDEIAAVVDRCYCRITTLLWVALATVALIVGGAGGGLYVYKLGPGFMGFVPSKYGEKPYGELLAKYEKLQKEHDKMINKAILNELPQSSRDAIDRIASHVRAHGERSWLIEADRLWLLNTNKLSTSLQCNDSFGN